MPGELPTSDVSLPISAAQPQLQQPEPVSEDRVDFPPLPQRDMTVTRIVISSFVITCLLTVCLLSYDAFNWLFSKMRIDQVIVMMTTIYVIIVYVRVVQLRKEIN